LGGVASPGSRHEASDGGCGGVSATAFTTGAGEKRNQNGGDCWFARIAAAVAIIKEEWEAACGKVEV